MLLCPSWYNGSIRKIIESVKYNEDIPILVNMNKNMNYVNIMNKSMLYTMNKSMLYTINKSR